MDPNEDPEEIDIKFFSMKEIWTMEYLTRGLMVLSYILPFMLMLNVLYILWLPLSQIGIYQTLSLFLSFVSWLIVSGLFRHMCRIVHENMTSIMVSFELGALMESPEYKALKKEMENFRNDQR